jgi:hypothetical protein
MLKLHEHSRLSKQLLIVIIVKRAAQRNQNKAVGAITFPIAGYCSSGIFGMLGI